MEHWKNLSLENLSEIHEGILYVEEWKCVPEFPFYMASSFGRIKSLSRDKKRIKGNYISKEIILKQSPKSKKENSYLQVTLCNETGSHQKLVHIVIANIFIENTLNFPEVNHKKGIKADNRVHQLEWNSRSQNQKHSYAIGLKDKKGDKHHFAKLSSKDVLNIRALSDSKEYRNYELAQKYNISQATICGIVKRNTWKHI